MNKLFFIKNYFLPAAFFSLIINLLLITPMFYMLQLYSRVIVTKSEEALWLLSLLLLVALLVMGALEIVKARILVVANNAIDAMIAPDLLKKMLEGATSAEQNPYHYALKDLHTVRAFLTGHGMIQLMEVMWLPVYMLIIYLMHPLMVLVLLIGSILMGCVTIINEYLTAPSLLEANAASRNTSRFVDSAMQNAEVVNAMGMLPALIRRWSSLNDRVIALQDRGKQSGRYDIGHVKISTKFDRCNGHGCRNIYCVGEQDVFARPDDGGGYHVRQGNRSDHIYY